MSVLLKSGLTAPPTDVQNKYEFDTEEAKEICSILGWQYDKAIFQTMRQKGKVYVRGGQWVFVIKEWNYLVTHLPKTLKDGRPMKWKGGIYEYADVPPVDSVLRKRASLVTDRAIAKAEGTS